MIDSATPSAGVDFMPTLRCVDWKTPPLVAYEVADEEGVDEGMVHS